jgi:AraC family transcriptional regulator
MNLSIPESPYGGSVIKVSEFSGLRLVDGIYSAKTNVPTHAHEQAVFCIALKGACNERYAAGVRNYKALTVEFLPPNECHSLDFPFTDTRAFSIDVATRWLERAREFSLRLEHSVHSHSGTLSSLMMKTYREFLETDDAAPLAIEGLMLEMLVETSRQQSQPIEKRPPRWLRQAIELLREQPFERFTITQVAATVGVHPVHLAREFRRFHHCTLGDFLRRLRIERACDRLQDSSDSLASIAVATGFSDQSHFSRIFKRVIGMTPAQYRSATRHPNPVPKRS